MMRKLMQINDETVEESKAMLNDAIEHLKLHTSPTLAEHAYLVGDRFSRADLSVAALLAPLFLPNSYGINWPTEFPEDVEAVISQYKPHTYYAEQMYAQHRVGK